MDFVRSKWLLFQEYWNMSGFWALLLDTQDKNYLRQQKGVFRENRKGLCGAFLFLNLKKCQEYENFIIIIINMTSFLAHEIQSSIYLHHHHSLEKNIPILWTVKTWKQLSREMAKFLLLKTLLFAMQVSDLARQVAIVVISITLSLWWISPCPSPTFCCFPESLLSFLSSFFWYVGLV